MNEQELKEIFRLLEEQGWEPRMCDTPVPYYDNAVMCGNPAGVGDIVTETKMMPSDYMDLLEEFMVRVKGDSMKDASILQGDMVRVNTVVQYFDGDIVLVLADGELTVKTYCEDEDGTPWLVPQNPEYTPFTLKDRQNVRIVGKVLEVLHPNPHVSYRSCLKLIKKAKAGMPEPREISQLQVSQAIREIAPQIDTKRKWYAVYRAMTDLNVVKEEDYDTFIEMVKTEVPHHKALPTRVELQRIALQSFVKPVSLWRAQNATVQGKRFTEYLKIAQRTVELLGE